MKADAGSEVCHGNEMEVSTEYKREAVGMLQSPGVSVSQIATELGIGANVPGVDVGSCARGRLRRFRVTADRSMRR